MNPKANALIIDDDRISGIVLEKLILEQSMGAAVIDHPADLEAVLGDISNLRIIFVDLELPHFDGYEVLDFLRQRLGNSIPIVAYTVHTSEFINAMDKGFDGFFGKPLNSKAFPANLNRLLQGERIMAIL